MVNLCSDSPVDKAETLIAGTLRLLHLLIRKGRGEREILTSREITETVNFSLLFYTKSEVIPCRTSRTSHVVRTYWFN